MTPEFKSEDADARTESHDAKWRIHSRAGHTAMVSGMRSLSDTHEQLVVAWTGEVMLQSQTAPSPRPTTSTFSALGMVRGNSFQGQGVGAGGIAGTAQGLKPDITPVPEPAAKKVFAGEFSEEEKKEVEKELERFTIVESEHEGQARMKYVPVFVPPAMSKGHYEQFCKKSTCISTKPPRSRY